MGSTTYRNVAGSTVFPLCFRGGTNAKGTHLWDSKSEYLKPNDDED